MIIELSKSNLKVESEKPLTVYYDEKLVGEYFADLFVENEIIVELKSVKSLAKEHEVQLVNYLNGLKKEIGLLINFGPSGVEVKRNLEMAKVKSEDSDLPLFLTGYLLRFPDENVKIINRLLRKTLSNSN